MRISKKILAAFVAALMVIAMPMSALADMTEFYGTGSHVHNLPSSSFGYKNKNSGPPIPIPGMSTPSKETYHAYIGETGYETLEAAVAAAVDGDTITLNCYSGGNGIKFPQGKFNDAGLTIDFGGYEYWVDGTLVGSTGTETNGFQLLKDNKITFQNGAIYSLKAKILLQNYSDLTLDHMSVKTCNNTYWNCYTLSNNNGNVRIKDSVVSASEHPDPMTNIDNNFAFDVCRYASYPEVNVTVEGDSYIYGNIELYASGSDSRDGFSLTLNGGTYTGEIVVTQSAKNAMENYDNVSITKAEDVEIGVTNGYAWVDNKLDKATPVDTMNITVEDNIDLNISVDVENTYAADKIRYSYATPDVQTGDTTETVTKDVDDNDDAQVKVELAPAQILDTVTVQVLDENNQVIRENETSIAAYCEEIIETVEANPTAFGAKSAELAELAKSTLDYGKAAATYFNYNTDAFEGKSQQITTAFDAASYSDNSNSVSGNLIVDGVSFRATSKPELLFRVTTETPEYVLAETTVNVTGDNVTGAKAKFVKKGGYTYLQVTNLNITDFNKELTISGYGFSINYKPITWVVKASASANGNTAALGNAIGNYYVASAAYFA